MRRVEFIKISERKGEPPAAKTEMQQKAGLLVDLKEIDSVLGKA
jgi:hypothetical protein